MYLSCDLHADVNSSRRSGLRRITDFAIRKSYNNCPFGLVCWLIIYDFGHDFFSSGLHTHILGFLLKKTRNSKFIKTHTPSATNTECRYRHCPHFVKRGQLFTKQGRHQETKKCWRFRVPTAVFLNIRVFRYVTSCWLVHSYRRFEQP
jgi:hypothetical protein